MVGYVDFGTSYDDLAVEDGKLVIVTNADEVGQRVKTRLRKILGEWFLNVNSGLPYYDGQILGGKDFNYIKLSISSQIMTTEGVSGINALNIMTDPTTKKTTVYVEVVIDEQIYKLSEEL